MPVTFADLGVPAPVAERLDALGITAPFPVQEMVIPDLLSGRDVAAKAPTGSGKTLAFGIPAVSRVGPSAPGRPRALVLAPTRELAQQIAVALRPIARTVERSVAAFFGGTGYGPQTRALREGVDVAVATPGRLEDLIAGGSVSLAAVDIVVVDEADRMADMGFLPVVVRLLDQVRPDRQTMLFSATLDGDVDELVRRYQQDPVVHELVIEESHQGEVRHLFVKVSTNRRLATAARIATSHGPTIIFCRTRLGSDRVAKQLGAVGVAAVAIHGDKTQRDRDRSLRAFTSGRSPVMVATDVAARGIHVDQVACVIHYDPPADAKDYVHRSGRTGRAGEDGVVVSLVIPEREHPVAKLRAELDLPGEWDTEADALGSVVPVDATAALATRGTKRETAREPKRPPGTAKSGGRAKAAPERARPGAVGTVPVRASWLPDGGAPRSLST